MSRLVIGGHALKDIGEYTLPQFIIHLHAVERRDAESRRNFVTDLSISIGGVLSSSKDLQEHLNSLGETITEEKGNGG